VDPLTPRAASDAGARLAAQADWLRLLLAHLAGPALRARFELDDLLQDVFVRVLASPAAPAADERALRAQLALQARRTVIDAARALRAARRQGELDALRLASSAGSGVGQVAAARGPGPATEARGREAARAALSAFLRLVPEHRRVLGLRQLEGLSAAQCAQRMGRSETAVHSLYRRALEAWSQALGGPGRRGGP
jgi:RNA polymerase sigma factor (sigma-70 family)